MFFRRRLGAFDASASLGSLGVSFFFSAIFPFFFSFSEISLPSWGFFPLSGVFISSPFYFVLFRNCFFSFLSGISSYEFIVFSLSFFFLSLFASESETERQKKDFDEWNSFPSIIFHPLALSWFLSPRENPYPLRTDGFTSHWHVVARDKRPTNMLSLFLFARKTLLFFFLFSNSRKKKVGALRELRTVWPRCHSNGGFLFLSRIRSWRHFVRRALSYNNYMLPHLHIAGHMFRASLAFLSTKLSSAKSLNIFQY